MKNSNPSKIPLTPFDKRGKNSTPIPFGLKGDLYGFTMIEIMVILAVTGIIMISIMQILGGTFRANSRIKWANKVEQDGVFVLGELRRHILNADTITPCGIGSSSITFNNINDGGITTIICEDEKISSESATTTVDLTTSQVKVSSCENFVSCDILPSSGEVSNVNFNFNLGAGISGGGNEDYVVRKFESSVTVRTR